MRRLLAASTLLVSLGALPAAAGPDPPFRATVEPVPAALRARMTSWRPGCPVPPRDLRLLHVSYRGFDGAPHTGELMVNRAYAWPVVRIFRTLYAARFPIRRMRLIDRYGSSDRRSLAADNTVGFLCARIGGSGTWSEHAYGRAIDVNPLENPEVRNGVVSPPAGRAYLDRSRWKPGMIHGGDKVVRAFAAIGWKWGGYWHSLQDYQHFSATGR